MTLNYKKIQYALENNDQLVLFLDYDGTLADFVKHPDVVVPNNNVVQLLNALVKCENIAPAIISGRRLQDLQQLIPLEHILLAGTYGLEIQIPGNEIFHPLDFGDIRPKIEKVKPEWNSLIKGKPQFFLEDKGWTLALHARFADDQIAGEVLSAAKKIARKNLDLSIFQINEGHKFLEASPHKANKGQCVEYLMEIIPIDNKLMIYMGDDDKDEKAFEVVQAHGGFAVRVCSNIIHNPIEDWRLENPKAARQWLWSQVDRFC